MQYHTGTNDLYAPPRSHPRGAWAIFPGAQPTEQPRRVPKVADRGMTFSQRLGSYFSWPRTIVGITLFIAGLFFQDATWRFVLDFAFIWPWHTFLVDSVWTHRTVYTCFGTVWPFWCWCAVKLWYHSLTRGLILKPQEILDAAFKDSEKLLCSNSTSCMSTVIPLLRPVLWVGIWCHEIPSAWISRIAQQESSVWTCWRGYRYTIMNCLLYKLYLGQLHSISKTTNFTM